MHNKDNKLTPRRDLPRPKWLGTGMSSLRKAGSRIFLSGDEDWKGAHWNLGEGTTSSLKNSFLVKNSIAGLAVLRAEL
jgi:hypothetical protein